MHSAFPPPPIAAQPDLAHQFRLRGLIFAGAFATIACTGWWLDARASWLAFGIGVGVCALANALFWLALKRANPESVLFGQLVTDLVALGALLYFIGGAVNPLIWMLLLPLTIAAMVLPRQRAWLVAAAACAIYTWLMTFHHPIPDMRLPDDSGFALHVLGMWAGFIISALLITHFLSRMAADIRARDRALAQAREQALRDDNLVTLGTLAAGAAHDLGTPLGTLAVLTEELATDIDEQAAGRAHDKLELMDNQIERCKQVIADIASSAGIEAAQGGQALALAEFVDDTIDQWRTRRTGIAVRYRVDGVAPGPRVVADRNLASALTNLFDNAADASPSTVDIAATWTRDTLALSVSDRGSGLEPDKRIGKRPFTDKPGGYGLGLYLSYGIIERMGGMLSIQPRLGGGTTTEVQLPLDRLRI